MEIYLITDLTNGMKYVGKTINTKEQRWSGHLSGDLYVDNAIRKHGIENATLETLEYVYDVNKLNDREQYWIKELDTLTPNGYNILPGGDCYNGKGALHEFNKTEYLRKIFYPQKKSKRNAIRCKIYIIDSNLLEDSLYKIADFEPYKSHKSLDVLSQDEWVYWYRFTNNFTKRVFDIIGHEKLCSIAKNITYAPSISYIADNSFDEYGICLDQRCISDCIKNHWLISLYDEYNRDDNYDYLYITIAENCYEYDNFATNKMQSILKYWEDNPDEFEWIQDMHNRAVKFKAEQKENQKQKKIKETTWQIEEFLRAYANRVSVRENKDNTCTVSVSILFDKFSSGRCDNKLDAFIMAKNWIIKVLSLENDAFEKYYNAKECEEKLMQKRKFAEAKQIKNDRLSREKQLRDERLKLFSMQTTQN